MNEEQLLQYFYDVNLEKQLIKLSQKYKNKKIGIYGCGMMFNLICRYFDISKLNILGVYDSRFENSEQKEYNGFSIKQPQELKNADIILVSTWNTIDIIENLKFLKVKTKPLMQKKFRDLVKEIWS